MTAPAVIDHQATGYSLRHASCMARAAAPAHKDWPAVQRQASARGFDEVRHHETRFTPPFSPQDTQAYTVAGDRMIITAFRGTEPAQLKDWLTDGTTPPSIGPGGTGHVHHGFAEALESVFPDVPRTHEELHTNGQSVWFTGHSLGKAPAMLAAAHNAGFKERTYRFVNNDGIVPQLPPPPVHTHVGALRHIDSRGRIHESMPLIGGLTDRAEGLTAGLFAPAGDGVRDHFMDSCPTVLEKNLK